MTTKFFKDLNLKSITTPLLKTSLFKAVHKVWTLPRLPIKLNKFYNHIIIRALRVIGGICFIIMVSKIYDDWTLYIKVFIDILAAIQIFQMVLFGFIKVIYAAYILKFYPQLFEVRNSPLDKTATTLAKIIYCGWTGSCFFGAAVTGIGGATLTTDTLLERAGYEPYFGPMIKDTIDFIHNRASAVWYLY